MLNFHFLRDRRRAELLRQPFPPQWEGYLRAHVAHYGRLSEAEAARLRDDLRVFLVEKEWEGAGGAAVTDEMKVVVAAQACLLLLGWDDGRRADLFPNVHSILVYPGGFRASGIRRRGWVESEEERSLLGEAWQGDWPVVLAWESVRAGGEDAEDGQNLVLHEFAHKLDMVDGNADGVPRLSSAAEYEEWAGVLSHAYRTLRFDVTRGRRTVLDSYGAENEAEFFAVATETFFERPHALRVRHPRLYEVLRRYYNQDAAARFPAPSEDGEDSEEMTTTP